MVSPDVLGLVSLVIIVRMNRHAHHPESARSSTQAKSARWETALAFAGRTKYNAKVAKTVRIRVARDAFKETEKYPLV